MRVRKIDGGGTCRESLLWYLVCDCYSMTIAPAEALRRKSVLTRGF